MSAKSNKKTTPKTNTREEQRAAAAKKAKQKMITMIIAGGVLVVAIIAVLVVVNHDIQTRVRVFTANNVQMVSLYREGNFTAVRPNNVMTSGTFTERTEGGVTTVSFIVDGTSVDGVIVNDVLTVPLEWDWGTCCGPGELPLR